MPTEWDSAKEIEFGRGMYGPAWRWKQAVANVDGRWRCSRTRDPILKQLIRCLQARERNLERAVRQFPAMVACIHIREEQPQLNEALQLMVVADLPPEEIATRLDVNVETVHTYEAIFLDIRACRQADVWLRRQLLVPLERARNFQLAARFRAALTWGRVAVDAILAEDIDFPVTGEEPLFRRRLQVLALELEAVNMLRINHQTIGMFFKNGMKWHREQNRIRLEERKLDEKCAAAVRKYELDRLRLETRILEAEARTWQAKAKANVNDQEPTTSQVVSPPADEKSAVTSARRKIKLEPWSA